MQEGDAMRADRLLQLPESTAGEDDDEAPQWEPFREGVEYDVASDDEDADSDDEEAVEAADGDAGGGREGEGDLTAKFFKNPGMFNLTEMENFSLQAEEEEFERARLEERREAKRAAGGADDDEDEDDDSEEENPLAASDDEGSDASDSDALRLRRLRLRLRRRHGGSPRTHRETRRHGGTLARVQARREGGVEEEGQGDYV